LLINELFEKLFALNSGIKYLIKDIADEKITILPVYIVSQEVITKMKNCYTSSIKKAFRNKDDFTNYVFQNIDNFTYKPSTDTSYYSQKSIHFVAYNSEYVWFKKFASNGFGYANFDSFFFSEQEATDFKIQNPEVTIDKIKIE
jgi:hypothetical protein